ncbi:MAG TPA: GGDEF domain-containing protein [Pyrinomonadaceae bacterium]|nr:GGDEF domain-containing protein [Pyrinomonadaceae bacterium]
MDSKIGLLIQLTGVLLITFLTVCLQRSVRSVALKYWTYAWLCLSLSLICLRFAFEYAQHAASLYSLYFFGEYLFGFLLVAGCRSLYEDGQRNKLSELIVIPLGIIAISLPMLSSDFDEMFSLHSLIIAGFFVAAALALRHSPIKTLGWRVMYVGVVLLAIEFFGSFAIQTSNQFFGTPTYFLQFNSIVDLVLETALGFGMVIVLLEKLVADVKNANEALEEAHEELEKLVNTDPLTAAFNRHAFYGFVGKKDGDSMTGCVGFFDIDNLKDINDVYGHQAGDHAIRAVVHAIREIIRAEDLIYRWGGDEFFVIMVGMQAEMATIRMQRLESLLCDVRINGGQDSIEIGVSSGFSDFCGYSELEQAIKQADGEMYKRKAMRKRARVSRPAYSGLLPEPQNQLTA